MVMTVFLVGYRRRSQTLNLLEIGRERMKICQLTMFFSWTTTKNQDFPHLSFVKYCTWWETQSICTGQIHWTSRDLDDGDDGAEEDERSIGWSLWRYSKTCWREKTRCDVTRSGINDGPSLRIVCCESRTLARQNIPSRQGDKHAIRLDLDLHLG